MSGISAISEAIIAFALLVVGATGALAALSRRARNFVFVQVIGGIFVLVTQAKTDEARRDIAIEERRRRVRQAITDFSEGINSKALAGEGRIWAPSDAALLATYQAVTVLKMECPELKTHLDRTLEALAGEGFVASYASKELIEPVIEGTRALLDSA
jgi:hypothetical protein